MRAAPALQITVNSHGWWRAAVLFLAACVCAAMLAWWWTQPSPAAAWLGAAAGASGLVALLALGLVARMPPSTLTWDAQVWRLGPRNTTDDAAASGQIAVAIDLGAWMLLRFTRDATPGSRRRSTWIAVQRPGLAGQWHALRCAVYSPRPVRPERGV